MPLPGLRIRPNRSPSNFLWIGDASRPQNLTKYIRMGPNGPVTRHIEFSAQPHVSTPRASTRALRAFLTSMNRIAMVFESLKLRYRPVTMPYISSVIGRPQCNRGFPGFPGKCKKNVKMSIWEGPRKMSKTIEIKCQMGFRRRRFWTLRKMSKILEKCGK